MRPSLLPGLIAAARRNADRGFADLALFEVGQVYRGDRPEDQVTAAAAIRAGTSARQRQPAATGRARPAAVVGLRRQGRRARRFSTRSACRRARCRSPPTRPAWFHPGRSGTIRQGPKTIIGTFGEFHPKVLEVLDAEAPLAGFELILDAIPLPKVRATKTKPPLELSAFQPVRRDFAFVVARDVAAAKIVRAAEGADRKLIVAVNVFDVFESEALGPDAKSVAIEVTMQPSERTLTDEEIDETAGKVVAAVTKATGGTLRA